MKTAVVRIINDKGETLFLLRNTKPFGWCLPGGEVETNEDALTAGIRETFEETGIELHFDQVKIIGEDTAFDGTSVTVLEAILDHTPLVKINKREHLNSRWLTTHRHTGYSGAYALEVYELSFAGRTKSFIDLGREIFCPDFRW